MYVSPLWSIQKINLYCNFKKFKRFFGCRFAYYMKYKVLFNYRFSMIKHELLPFLYFHWHSAIFIGADAPYRCVRNASRGKWIICGKV